MRTRRTIRVCLLFLGITSALGSVPLVLGQIDAIKNGGMPGAEGFGGGLGVDVNTVGGEALNGVDLERFGLEGVVSAEGAAPPLRRPTRTTPRPPTRVLGPDD